MTICYPPGIRLPHGCSPKKIALASSTLPIGLVASWKLDENSGTSLADVSGKGNTGTTHGSNIWTSSGLINAALSFDGSTNYASVADSSSLQLTTTGTIASWFKYATIPSAYRTMFNKGATALGNNTYSMYVSSAGLLIGRLAAGSLLCFTSIAAPTANAWHHSVFTWDGTTGTLYLDGLNVNTGAQAVGTPNTSTFPLYIGSAGTAPADPWQGQLDEQSIWNRALTAQEVWRLYLGGLGQQYPFSQ